MASSKTTPLPPSKRTQIGFTLVEILVSFVIFAFGMLGAAGLQLWSLKAGKQSGNMTVAASLIKDYSEIMISTPPAILGGTNSTSSTFFHDQVTSAQIKALTGAVTSSQCIGATCTHAIFAQSSVRDWLKRLDEALPDVKVSVCIDSTPADSSGNYKWACDGIGQLVVAKMSWLVPNTNSNTGDAFAADATSGARPLIVVTVFGNVEDYFRNN